MKKKSVQSKKQQKQKTSRKIKIEKIIAIIIYGLIILFFSAEMFMKPISGEDAHQAKCIAKAEDFSAYKSCVRSSLNYIPRLGQTIHTMIITSFSTMPEFGAGLVFRLIDALMCIGIIYMIVFLAHGRRPKLTYKDALVASLATAALLFSDFTQMFFNGFSNVHNYVPAVLFALLFFYHWFYGDKIVEKSEHPGIHYALFVICAFCFGASLELNPFIILAMVIGGSIIALIRKVKIKKIGRYLFNHLPALLGVIFGFIMQYVIGRGFTATIGRSGNYLSSSKISDLWTNPGTAIPHFFYNTVLNYSHYLPYLFLAIVALVVLFRKNKRDKRNKLFTAIIVYALIYIAGCFTFSSIMWRITASVFCLLLVPITFLISEVVDQLKGQWQLVCSLLMTILFVAMCADNIGYHITSNSATQDILDRTTELGCVSRAYVEEQKIGSRSLFFGFKHSENTFSYINEDWYHNNYLVDGYQFYPIVDTCYLPGENTEETK